jgi:hypothetical protein
VKDNEREYLYCKGVNAAKQALVGATFPLLLVDETKHGESANIEAMGWNSVCAGEENQLLWKKERERLRKNREYFEDGCLCIKNKKIELKGKDTSDLDAVLYYENNCNCSRNYK